MYVYWKKNFSGKWHIQTSADRPSEKLAEGNRQKVRQIVELPFQHEGLRLDTLADLYPCTAEQPTTPKHTFSVKMPE